MDDYYEKYSNDRWKIIEEISTLKNKHNDYTLIFKKNGIIEQQTENVEIDGYDINHENKNITVFIGDTW